MAWLQPRPPPRAMIRRRWPSGCRLPWSRPTWACGNSTSPAASATWNAQQYALMQRADRRATADVRGAGWPACIRTIAPPCSAGWQAFLASGERYETSYRLLHADGTVSHLRAQALAIKDAQGRVIRARRQQSRRHRRLAQRSQERD
ncbi:MAG: PAS domain-containing protein [Rhodopseudomonas palustris]|nr:PAS domain-containing protein [Rhodopseudomonas palustris]